MSKKPIIALIYDFDNTLCPKPMQEYSFIPHLKISPKEFWTQSDELVRRYGMDPILAYMYLMLKKARERSIAVRREDFVKLGAKISYFPGVTGWFERINQFVQQEDAICEHYVISSGLMEIIEGSAIYRKFKAVYGSEFHYDENNVADWPLWAVNYTAKTQFLFRINKGVYDTSDVDGVNKYVAEDRRRIPFNHMIYIGDGYSDVPCMKIVKVNGGKAICVYDKNRKHIAETLFRDERVNFVVKADYSSGRPLEKLVKQIVVRTLAEHKLLEFS